MGEGEEGKRERAAADSDARQGDGGPSMETINCCDTRQNPALKSSGVLGIRKFEYGFFFLCCHECERRQRAVKIEEC